MNPMVGAMGLILWRGDRSLTEPILLDCGLEGTVAAGGWGDSMAKAAA